jgi:hypothetical protein
MSTEEDIIELIDSETINDKNLNKKLMLKNKSKKTKPEVSPIFSTNIGDIIIYLTIEIVLTIFELGLLFLRDFFLSTPLFIVYFGFFFLILIKSIIFLLYPNHLDNIFGIPSFIGLNPFWLIWILYGVFYNSYFNNEYTEPILYLNLLFSFIQIACMIFLMHVLFFQQNKKTVVIIKNIFTIFVATFLFPFQFENPFNLNPVIIILKTLLFIITFTWLNIYSFNKRVSELNNCKTLKERDIIINCNLTNMIKSTAINNQIYTILSCWILFSNSWLLILWPIQNSLIIYYAIKTFIKVKDKQIN